MKPQRFASKNESIREQFDRLKSASPDRLEKRLNLSWSNWGFGMEPLAVSARRLQSAGIKYIELHGNHYGDDLGYEPRKTLKLLQDHDLKVAGICGMFTPDNDLSSNRGTHRQAAIDYIRRELAFASAVGASYLLVVPGAVGRPQAIDNTEFDRSAETLRKCGDWFARHQVRAAIEPIRAAEVSLVHTIEEAKAYLEKVAHPAITHINGDVYHMQAEESHIGEAVLAAGDSLINLHLADSNRRALGEGSMDLDTIIRALYLIGFNTEGCYVTPEPLGPGGDPYPAMHGRPDPQLLDQMVTDSAAYLRQREEAVRDA